MIEPAHHLVKMFDETGEALPFRSITLPGIPRVGDDVQITDGIRRITRVLWEANVGNWVSLWAELIEPDTMWCPAHQHHKWCEHNGGVLSDSGWQAPQ